MASRATSPDKRLQTVAIIAAGIVVAAVAALVATASPQLALAVVIGAVTVSASVRRPAVAAHAFVVGIFLESSIATTGVTVAPTKITGAALVVTALLAAASPQGRVRPAAWRMPVVVGAIACWFAWAAVSIGWAWDTNQATFTVQRLSWLAAAWLAIGVVIRSVDDVRAIGWTVLACASASVVVGVASGRELAGRTIGTFADPNEFAAVLVPAAVFAYLIAERKPGVHRIAAILGGALCVFGLIASQSRGGLLALVAAVGVITLTARGRERLRLAGSLAIISGVVGIALILAPGGADIRQRLTSGDSSGRADLWRVAVNEFRAHPIGGVGIANYPVVSDRYLDDRISDSTAFRGRRLTVHNIYLEFAAELGVVGLVAAMSFLLGAIVSLFRALRRVRGRREPEDADLLLTLRWLVVSLCAMQVVGIFLSSQYMELWWVLLGLVPVLSVLPATNPASAVTRPLSR